VIAIMMCDDCDVQMQEVFTASENFRLKGWVCPSCLHFAKAIGRERQLTIEDKQDDKKRSV
jgi:hypothetical protein